MTLLIDNYDSFSYNLYQLIGEIDADLTVARNDKITVEEIIKLSPARIVLSPGPGRPSDAGVIEEAARRLAGEIPILGVCLGHQAICEVYGADIIYAKKLMHGKADDIELDTDCAVFKGLPKVIKAARYHSLAAKEDAKVFGGGLKITARAGDGEIMAVADEEKKLYGVQFHPESILSPAGRMILENFLKIG